MPVVEAMYRGVAVACSNVSAMPEVAGDAAELFDPTTRRDRGGAHPPAGHPERRAELVARGHERWKAFTLGARRGRNARGLRARPRRGEPLAVERDRLANALGERHLGPEAESLLRAAHVERAPWAGRPDGCVPDRSPAKPASAAIKPASSEIEVFRPVPMLTGSEES